MSKQISLTDDELSIIQTSLQMSIMSYDAHIQMNGEKGLDSETLEVIKGMKELLNRISKE